LFAQDLFSAYLKYAKSHGLKIEVLSTSNYHFSAQVTGHKAWSVFKHEGGKHCVQRVPPTEKSGRRQTSYLTVGVLPVPTTADITIPTSEIDSKTQRGHGKGGQHQNTTDSAVRMRHIPTGLQVFINGRDQNKNKREALRILTAKVTDHHRAKKDAEYGKLRADQMADQGRGNKIRTYNYIDSRAVDHRTGKKSSKVRRIIDRGDFDLLK
jgi:peptide chain release factor 1